MRHLGWKRDGSRLEFGAHTIIYAEGAPTESFVDDESREMFDNATEYNVLYPEAVGGPGRFCAPRFEQAQDPPFRALDNDWSDDHL